MLQSVEVNILKSFPGSVNFMEVLVHKMLNEKFILERGILETSKFQDKIF